MLVKQTMSAYTLYKSGPCTLIMKRNPLTKVLLEWNQFALTRTGLNTSFDDVFDVNPSSMNLRRKYFCLTNLPCTELALSEGREVLHHSSTYMNHR